MSYYVAHNFVGKISYLSGFMFPVYIVYMKQLYSFDKLRYMYYIRKTDVSSMLKKCPGHYQIYNIFWIEALHFRHWYGFPNNRPWRKRY